MFVVPAVQRLQEAGSIASSLRLADTPYERQSFIGSGAVFRQRTKGGVGEDHVGGFPDLIRDGLSKCPEMFEECPIDVLPGGLFGLGRLAIDLGLGFQKRNFDLPSKQRG